MNRAISLPASVDRFIARLTTKSQIEQIAIFGSRAVGDNDDRADCDVALYAPELSRAEFARLRVEASETRSLYWISLVHFDRTPEPLRERIRNQGITIYDRTEASRQPSES